MYLTLQLGRIKARSLQVRLSTGKLARTLGAAGAGQPQTRVLLQDHPSPKHLGACFPPSSLFANVSSEHQQMISSLCPSMGCRLGMEIGGGERLQGSSEIYSLNSGSGRAPPMQDVGGSGWQRLPRAKTSGKKIASALVREDGEEGPSLRIARRRILDFSRFQFQMSPCYFIYLFLNSSLFLVLTL